MKITDYGLWFKRRWISPNLFFKKIFSLERGYHYTYNIYLNGTDVGNYFSDQNYFSIYIPLLNAIGFVINPESPGEGVGGEIDVWWNFPANYIISESDFEALP